MMRRLALAAVLAILVTVSLRDSSSSVADSSVHDVDLLMARADGSHVMLQFAIDARTPEEALQAAVGAAAELLPEATLVSQDHDGVTAQFAPWWWQWDATELPVQVVYNPAGARAGVTAEDVEAALAAWTGLEGTAFGFRYVGLSDAALHLQDNVEDGLNTISWRSLDCAGGCVLGITTKTEARETDVILNSNPEARLGDGRDDTLDTRTVLVHEAGHMAGLEHSCPLFTCSASEQEAVMYFQYGGERRALAEDDIAGLRSLYPGSGGTSGLSQTTLAIEVTRGWSLTVLPAGPLNSTMDRLRCVDSVHAWDGGAWRTWIRGAHPLLQDIVTSEAGTAYWTYASAECSYLFVVSE